MKKGEFALKIACSISSLITSFESKEVPLKALKIPVDKLSTGGSQLADESDCEYEPETPKYKFLYDDY